jgi:hypothetical protein
MRAPATDGSVIHIGPSVAVSRAHSAKWPSRWSKPPVARQPTDKNLPDQVVYCAQRSRQISRSVPTEPTQNLLDHEHADARRLRAREHKDNA